MTLDMRGGKGARGEPMCTLVALLGQLMTKSSSPNGLSCISSIVVARLACYAPVLLCDRGEKLRRQGLRAAE